MNWELPEEQRRPRSAAMELGRAWASRRVELRSPVGVGDAAGDPFRLCVHGPGCTTPVGSGRRRPLRQLVGQPESEEAVARGNKHRCGTHLDGAAAFVWTPLRCPHGRLQDRR